MYSGSKTGSCLYILYSLPSKGVNDFKQIFKQCGRCYIGNAHGKYTIGGPKLMKGGTEKVSHRCAISSEM